MFNDSIPLLKIFGIEQYLLEVIKTNKSAFTLYKKAGFKVARQFNYYTSAIGHLNVVSQAETDRINIKEINKPDWNILRSFWDFDPSWQNSIDSINRKVEHFRIIGACDNIELIGYGIVEPMTGDITQIGVNNNYRQKGLGKLIFSHLVKLIESENIKVINITDDDESFKLFAKSLNLTPGLGQYEMILDI